MQDARRADHDWYNNSVKTLQDDDFILVQRVAHGDQQAFLALGVLTVVSSVTFMELKASEYNVRAQRDGSWVLRFEPDYLKHASAYIVTRKTGTEDESLGCVSAAVAPPAAD